MQLFLFSAFRSIYALFEIIFLKPHDTNYVPSYALILNKNNTKSTDHIYHPE